MCYICNTKSEQSITLKTLTTMLTLRFTTQNPATESNSYDWASKKALNGLCGYDITAAVAEFEADGYTFEEAIGKAAREQANFDNQHVSGGEFFVFEGSKISNDPHGNPCFDGKNAVIANCKSVVASGKLIVSAHGGGYFVDTINF